MIDNKKEKLVDLRRRDGLEHKEENSSFDSDFDSEKIKVNVLKTKSSKLFQRFSGSRRAIAELSEKSLPLGVSKTLDGAIKKLFYLLVFLLPIFVLPWPAEIYEFNKTLLLFFISGLAFLLWLAKMILIDRKIEIVRTPLDLPIIIFISIVLISTAFSVDKISSVLGFYGRFSDSLMVYLSLAALYFVGVNNIGNSEPVPSPSSRNNQDGQEGNNKKELSSGHPELSSFSPGIIRAFLASSFIVVIASLIYFLGFKFIPWDETQFRSFNLVGGSLNILAIYLTAVILIALGWRGAAANAMSKHLMSVLIIISLILLAFIDFILAWIVLAVCLVLALGLAGIKAETRRCLVSTGLILLISLTFIATSLTALNNNIQSDLESSLISSSVKDRLISSSNSQIANDGFAKEVILDKNTAVAITMAGLKNIKSDPISAVVGSGPGTYLYNFAKFKPAEFNGSAFWSLRFDKAGSEILEKVSTLGILGALSYLIVIILAGGMFLKMMFQRKTELSSGYPELSSVIYLFAAWFGLLLFQFLYLESTTTKFIFWLLTIIMAAERCWTPLKVSSTFVLNLKKEPSTFYSSSLALLIITAAFGYSCYYQFNFYQAEAGHKKARVEQSKALKNNNLSQERAWEILNQSKDDFSRAADKNQYRGEYQISLADVYFERAKLAFLEENKKGEDERDTKRIALEAKNAIDCVKKAADSNSNNIIFQQKLAVIYAALAKNMRVVGASEWAVKSYQKAIELEPTNPVLYAELGKIYAAANKTDLAAGEFEKALKLKNNYLDAGLQLGLAYEKQKDSQKAISQLNSLGSVERMDDFIASGQIISSNSSSIDIDIVFQLGRIYYNEGEINKAKDIFLKVAKINPVHANAHYSLGLIYEKEGNKKAALKEFEIVLAANAANEEVKERIDELRGTSDGIIEREEE